MGKLPKSARLFYWIKYHILIYVQFSSSMFFELNGWEYVGAPTNQTVAGESHRECSSDWRSDRFRPRPIPRDFEIQVAQEVT